MHFGLVLPQILFLLEPLITFLALEGLLELLEKAPPPLFRRVDDVWIVRRVYHDNRTRSFSLIYFK